MQQDSKIYVGLDTSKLKISVAVAEPGRDGEVRFVGDIDSAPEAVERLVTRLAKRHRELAFCYEAGPTGYGLYRQITGLGHACTVADPEAGWGTGQDQPARCAEPGPPAHRVVVKIENLGDLLATQAVI